MYSLPLNIKFRNRFILLAVTPMLLLMAVGKDLLHAWVHHYHFYFSESALFETFWLLFVPLLLLITHLQKKMTATGTILFVLLLSLVHIAVFSGFVFAMSALFYDHTFGFTQLFVKSGLQNGIACLLIYTMAVIAVRPGKMLPGNNNPENTTVKIPVRDRNTTILLDIENIMYIKSVTPYIALVTRDKTFIYNGSLKTFMAEKATRNFIQVHKTTIVNTAFIQSYKSRKNGDYDLVLVSGRTLRVSRHYRRHFISSFQ